MRDALLMVTAVLVVATLVACDNNLYQGPIAVQKVGSSIRFVACQSIEVNSVKVRERNFGIFRKWTTIVDAQVSRTVEAGEVLSPGDFVASGSEPVEPFDLETGNELSIALKGEENSVRIVAVFPIDSGGVPESEWLHPDGSTSAEPCS